MDYCIDLQYFVRDYTNRYNFASSRKQHMIESFNENIDPKIKY